MIDIATHRIIDLIPSRDLVDVTQWLKTYPNLILISRDGSVTYKKAISNAHPQAQQVSDRFHLFKNLIDYGKEALKRKLKILINIPILKQPEDHQSITEICKENENRKKTLKQKYMQISSLKAAGLNQTQICKELNMDVRTYKKLVSFTAKQAQDYFQLTSVERTKEKLTRKWKTVRKVRELKASGLSISAIHREIGIDPRTVKRYLDPNFKIESNRQKHKSILNPYRSYIHQQLELGMMSSIIEKSVRTMGYTGSSSTLRHYCSDFKKQSKSIRYPQKNEGETIKRNHLIKLLYRPLEKVPSITEEQFNVVMETVPEFKLLYQLIWDFKKLVSEKKIDQLIPWLSRASRLGVSEIDSFVKGVNRDIEAVANAILREENNGLAEGSVNKLKVIKRIMYGRCSFETLRKKTIQLEWMRKKRIFN